MFKKGHFYKHERMRDAFIEVLWCGHYSEKWKLKIRWWNRAGYCMNITKRVEIRDDKVKYWGIYNTGKIVIVETLNNTESKKANKIKTH